MAVSGLDSALSGLRIAQQQLTVISNNVSNVSTPGYSRKMLPQESTSINGVTYGVRGNAIIRNVDMNLERDLWTQVSAVSFQETQARYLNRIQNFHGAPDLEVSVAAEIAELQDKFAALADSPEDAFLQASVVDQAQLVARKMNEFSQLISQLTKDTLMEIDNAVSPLNDKLKQIADINKEIKFAKGMGRTAAALEDTRDKLVNELSKSMDISFFIRGDGVMVVQTKQGVQLADETAETLYYHRASLGVDNYYDTSSINNGLYVGNPTTQPNAINITKTGLGGELGALIELRDTTLPRQQAMMDELAHKMALRFDMQGLRLFSDPYGAIPADTAPNPGTNPPTPVPYVGFAGIVQVNPTVLNDISLVVKGTAPTDEPIQPGSNLVVRRIVDFVFGDVYAQEAVGAIDLRAAAGGATLQEWLGLYSRNYMTGTSSLSNFSDLDNMLTAGQTIFEPDPGGIPPTMRDTFTITFEETRTTPPLGPTTITINLTDAHTNHPIDGVTIRDGLDQLIAEINAQILAQGVDPDLAASASRNSYGQLILDTRGSMTINSVMPGGMTTEGLAYIGLTAGTYAPTDPSFEVVVGNNIAKRITIEPGDTEADLIAKLEMLGMGDDGVPGLAVAIDPLTGFLTLRPGDDMNDPTFGGDIKLIGGPITTDGSGSIPGGMGNGLNIIQALFGSASPISNINYSSLTSTGASVSFRSSELGPAGNLRTGVLSSMGLIDYAQNMVNQQAGEVIQAEAKLSDEQSFHDLLQQRLLDQSGVNIDEELSHLIVVQTAYSAAARVISTLDQLFDELLAAV